MRNKMAFVLIILCLLGVASCHAQVLSCRVSAGAVLPADRSFAAVEFRKQIAPRYAISLAGEFSLVESNVTPKLSVGLVPGLSLEAGFGWGHHWQKADCDDHVGRDVVETSLRPTHVLRRSFVVLAVIPGTYRPASRHAEIVCGLGF